MCNLAISTGKFPGEWKLAEVHPILKRGDGDCVNNYRPITILPALSKILERIVNSRLNKYLENNYLLSSSQYGFQSKKSTTDVIHDLTDFVTNKLDQNKKLLLEKLACLDVRETQLKLFSSYLPNRLQRVRIGDGSVGICQSRIVSRKIVFLVPHCS